MSGNAPRKSLYRRFVEPKDVLSQSPAAKTLIYALLLFWSLVVLFPLYWVLITSFKLPIHVNDGPVYLPFIDFQPSLHAWEYIFFELGNDTLRPYLNSIVIAFFSTLLAVGFGATSAYALVRFQYRPRFASILAFIALLAVVVWLS
ncbi:MAG: hypothetical protein MI741_00250, partial [Rhodospirillales bacterium]|nr:hypothetical protein [Rhodospirillales bacterium]